MELTDMSKQIRKKLQTQGHSDPCKGASIISTSLEISPDDINRFLQYLVDEGSIDSALRYKEYQFRIIGNEAVLYFNGTDVGRTRAEGRLMAELLSVRVSKRDPQFIDNHTLARLLKAYDGWYGKDPMTKEELMRNENLMADEFDFYWNIIITKWRKPK